MLKQLFINEEDAGTHDVYMGEGFLNKILAPCEMKSYITNNSALEHGKRYIVKNVLDKEEIAPRMQERSLTLTFNIHGNTPYQFEKNKQWLLDIFYGGEVNIVLPSLSNETIYKLIYTGKSISYNQDLLRQNGTITAGFVEPNPSDRAKKTDTAQ